MEILESLKRKVILFSLIEWYFVEAPKEIKNGWKNLLKFGLNFFSTPLLLKTLFSPWHGLKMYYPSRGLDIPKILETFISNLIFRILGAILRSFLIIVGLIFEFFIFFTGISFLLFWFFLPPLIILSFFYGLNRILF